MTSQQLRARLEAAIAIVADCERLMEDPHRVADSWDAVDLKHRAQDFMDLHRQAISEGCRP